MEIALLIGQGVSKLQRKFILFKADEFRGAQHTEKKMRKLVEEEKIILKVPYVIKEINGDKVFSGVDLLHLNKGN